MKLRDYQQDCITSIVGEARKGVVRQVIVLATGLGKTVIFSHLPTLVKAKGKKTLILAHREELLDQAKDKLLQIDSTLKVGIEQADRQSFDDDDVVIASVPTIGRANSKRIEKFKKEEFGLIIVDECFTGDTKIWTYTGTKNIKDVKVGDLILSYNEKNKLLEYKPVLRCFKNKSSQLVRINYGRKDFKRELITTPGHPFWIGDRYCLTKDLDCNSMMLYTIRDQKYDNSKLPFLWSKYGMFAISSSKNYPILSKCRKIAAYWNNILLKGMQIKSNFKTFLRYNEKNQFIPDKNKLGENEIKEPNAQYYKQRKDENNIKSHELETENSRREWETNSSTRATFNGGIGLEGGDNSHKNSKRKWLSSLLQNRYWKFTIKNSYRNRWWQSFFFSKKVSGSEKRNVLEGERMDSFEILKPTSDGTFGGLCADGYVYNIEVAENNNYFANGTLVHNCHHACAETYKNVFRYFGVLKNEGPPPRGIVLIGVTATPNRSDHLGLDQIFDKITFSYTLMQGIQNKYLANISAYTVQTNTDISQVASRGGDFVEGELSEAINNEDRNKLIVDSYRDIANNSKALVFAASVEHTKELTGYFQAAGYKADFVLGDTPAERRTEILEDFKNGQLQVVVNCMVLTEGYDNPAIETIIMARPTKSSVAYAQMIGRGTRLHPGKKALKLIDFVDNTGKHSIAGLPTLFGIPKGLKGLKGKNITDILSKLQQIEEVNPDYPVETIEDWSDENIQKIVKKVDIFAQAELPPEIKTNSKYSWEITQEGYRIQFPEEAGIKQTLRIEKDMLNKYEIETKYYEETVPCYDNDYSKWRAFKRDSIGAFNSIQEALQFGDNWIDSNKSQFSTMLAQDSKWRAESPSEAQLKLLKKLKVAVPKGLSKGQASVLIGKALGNRKRKSF